MEHQTRAQGELQVRAKRPSGCRDPLHPDYNHGVLCFMVVVVTVADDRYNLMYNYIFIYLLSYLHPYIFVYSYASRQCLVRKNVFWNRSSCGFNYGVCAYEYDYVYCAMLSRLRLCVEL